MRHPMVQLLFHRLLAECPELRRTLCPQMTRWLGANRYSLMIPHRSVWKYATFGKFAVCAA